jgi:hypothetical protein
MLRHLPWSAARQPLSLANHQSERLPMKIMNRIAEKFWRFYRIPNRIDTLQEALGRIESRLNRAHPPQGLIEFEFKVYSQWGEDGIIDHLIQSIPIPNKVFVEFGVETYVEANSLFLLKHRNWKGLVIDGSPENVESIKRGGVFWKYDLAAVCSFITQENIDNIISDNGVSGDIGLLSVDIDGNDYWVWKAITCIAPRIVICEYNSLFGLSANVSVPYQANFQRNKAHPSNMYYGASIGALTNLAESRGYSLVAGNSAGNNVFFVRNDCLGNLLPLNPEDVFVRAAFRESRGNDGSVQLLKFAERQAAISHLPVVDVTSGQSAPLSEFIV